MAKKFIISESEKNDIRKMYGLILEQQRCDQWKNGTFQQGDGVKTPKITITKTPSLIEGTYEGPDSAGCIQRASFNDRDTPHQLAGILVFYEAAPYLKQLYKQGIYVKPDMKGITMERVPNKLFKISIPLIKTTEDKAVTSINERGGMGHTGDLTEISNIENSADHKLIEKRTITAGDMTETFICFRNIKNYPIKTSSQNVQSQQNQKSQTIVGTSYGDLRQKISEGTQNISIDPSSIKMNISQFTLTYNVGNTKILKMSLIFDDKGQLENRMGTKEDKQSIRGKNLNMVELTPINTNTDGIQWVLVYFK